MLLPKTYEKRCRYSYTCKAKHLKLTYQVLLFLGRNGSNESTVVSGKEHIV